MNHSQARPIDTGTFTIGVLSVTACVLFVGLMFLLQVPAQAIGTNDRAGDFVMCTQQVTTTTEALILIDAAAKQMLIYEFDYGTRTLDILRRVNLAELPGPRDQQPAEEQQRQEPRRRR